MDQRSGSLSLYSVICPRCETLSSVEESSCPYCGADRHGAVLTSGAITAVQAVEASRGARRHLLELTDVNRVECFPNRAGYEARLPGPAVDRVSVLEAPRRSNSMLATVAMAGVVIGACVLVRGYFEHQPSTPRAGAVPVAVAGTVRQVAPKIDVADRVVEARSPDAPTSPVHTASPLIPVVASSKDSTHQPVASQRPIETKPPAARTVRPQKTASKAAAACPQKSDRACAGTTQRQASKAQQKRVEPKRAEPKQRQASKAPAHPEAAQAKSGTKDFQKVTAIPAPVKPAMTADDSWKPSKKNN